MHFENDIYKNCFENNLRPYPYTLTKITYMYNKMTKLYLTLHVKFDRSDKTQPKLNISNLIKTKTKQRKAKERKTKQNKTKP